MRWTSLDAKHHGISGKGLEIQYSMLHVASVNRERKLRREGGKSLLAYVQGVGCGPLLTCVMLTMLHTVCPARSIV